MTDKNTKTTLETKNSVAETFAYISLGGFFAAFLLSVASALAGGLLMMGSGVCGLVAVVLGLIDKNPKAWGIGLISPALFVFFLCVGLAMRG
jgi:hypothetical protein